MRVQIPRPLFNLLAIGLAGLVIAFIVMAILGSRRQKENAAKSEQYEERRNTANAKREEAVALEPKAVQACLARTRAELAKLVPDPFVVAEQRPTEIATIASPRFLDLEREPLKHLTLAGGFFLEGVGLGCKHFEYLKTSSKTGIEGFEEDIKAAEARIAALTSMPQPDLAVTAVYACPTDVCKGAVIWVSLKEQKVLAAIQVSAKSVDQGGAKDAAAIAKLADAKADKWFTEWAVKTSPGAR